MIADVKPLDGVRAKLARADEHIRQINDDIIVNRKVRIPGDSVRANLQVQGDASTCRRCIVFYLKGNPPPVDLSFTVLAGETIHQLRTSLDHLVYQLIVSNTKHPPTFNSAFPIIGKGCMRKKRSVSAVDVYAERTSRLKQDISASAEARLRALQPFHRGAAYEQDPLWQLSQLDDAYKHRLLLLAVHRISHYWVTVASRDIALRGNFQPNVRFEHGAEIGRIEITDPTFSIADSDLKVDGDLVVQIAFSEVAGERDVPVLPCLSHLKNSVAGIVKDFAPEFTSELPPNTSQTGAF